MGALVPLLATFALLAGATALVATVGSRRRRRRRRLSEGERARLEQTIGAALVELLDAAIEVREQVEDTLAKAREQPRLDAGAGAMRPLWRQIDDANLVHALVRLRDELLAWLRRHDALAVGDRQLVEQLDVPLDPIRAWVASEPGQPEGALLLVRLEHCVDCLRRLERALIEHRASGYR